MARHPAIEIPGAVEGGRLSAVAADRLRAALRQFEGGKVVVTVRPVKKARTLSQNAYLWAVVYGHIARMFRDHGTMVDADDVHELMKAHVGRLRQVFVTPAGEVLTGPGSTARLSTKEFSDYVEAVRAWAAGEGCNIPDPDPDRHG